MTKLRVLVVDDEELARRRLRALLADIQDPPSLVVAEAATAMAARVWLAEHPCDVVLLDINMPGLNGMQFAADLRLQRLRAPAQGEGAEPSHSSPGVIFITAHPEHALTAFDVEAVDYLTKPVRRDRLQVALQRAALRKPVVPASTPSAALSTADGPVGAGETHNSLDPVIVVSDRGRMVRVPVSDALYFKAELKYVTLRTAKHSHVLDDSLSDLEKRVGPQFIRVHRNALVAKHAVRALERRVIAGETDEDGGETWAVRVAPMDEWLAVSRRQVAAVREALAADGV